MTLDVAGFDADPVTEADWARLMHAQEPPHVVSGMTVTTGAGTRVLSVSTGAAVIAGVLVDITAAETVTHAAKTTSGVRLDWVVIEVDWNTNTVDVKAITGGTALPALTQTPGTLYQFPLAAVTVRQNVTTIAAADISRRAPVRREARVLHRASVSTGPIFASSSGVNVVSIAVPDPGWPYHVQVGADIRARRSALTPTGGVFLTARLAGVQFASVASSGLSEVPVDTHMAGGVSPVTTGPTSLTVAVGPLNFGANEAFEVQDAYSQVTVWQVPA